MILLNIYRFHISINNNSKKIRKLGSRENNILQYLLFERESLLFERERERDIQSETDRHYIAVLNVLRT